MIPCRVELKDGKADGFQPLGGERRFVCLFQFHHGEMAEGRVPGDVGQVRPVQQRFAAVFREIGKQDGLRARFPAAAQLIGRIGPEQDAVLSPSGAQAVGS